MRLLLFCLAIIAHHALAESAPTTKQQDTASKITVGYATGMPHSGDEDFIALHKAFLDSDGERLALKSKRLKHHPLGLYADYYQLRLDLDNADQQTIERFLTREEDSPVINKLRVEWLKLLGENQQWELFDKHYPKVVNGDIELTCYNLQSLSQKNYLLALRDARLLWFDGETLPQNCGTLFDAARSVNVIHEHDIRARLILALELNNVSLATYLADMMNKGSTSLSSEIRKARANPSRYLSKTSLSELDKDKRAIALFALHRLARKNPSLSLSHWNKLSQYFTQSERQYYFGWLGYEAARNLDDRALEWYALSGKAQLNERQLNWRVRAALRALNWHEVLNSINMMPPTQQSDIAWRYWKARAFKELGKHNQAQTLFAPLSVEYNFYGQLAADELADSTAITPTQTGYKPDEQSITTMWKRPDVQRTVALYRTGLRSDALEEWRWVVDDLNDRELLAAAEVARRNKMYDRAIGAADLTTQQHDFSMRYLAPYRNDMKPHVQNNDLDEAWVFGLMRQESRFATHAKSRVGATGLMQIMPSTARWVAQKLRIKNYRKSRLHDLETNMKIGTYYMKTVLSRAGSNEALASAAYNAGPGRAMRWRADRPLEGAIYVESIPFKETRTYVKKVMSNTVFYANQFGAPTSLKQKLGVVPAKENKKQRNKSHAS